MLEGYGNKSWISGSTLISMGSSFPFISCEALFRADNVDIKYFYTNFCFPSYWNVKLSDEGPAELARGKLNFS